MTIVPITNFSQLVYVFWLTFEVIFVFFYLVETKNVSYSSSKSILEWSDLNFCSAYLGGDIRVSFRVNADTEMLLTYLIVFLMETAVQPVWT